MKNVSLPSVLRGAGRLLDLGGTLSTYKRLPGINHEEAAYAALRGAWQALATNLYAVIEQEQADNPALLGIEREIALAATSSQHTERPVPTTVASWRAADVAPPQQ